MKYQTQKTSKTSLLSSRKIPISLDEKIIQVSKHLMESFLFKEEGFKELDTNCSKPIAGQANFQQSFTKGKILSTLETYQLECQPVGYSFYKKANINTCALHLQVEGHLLAGSRAVRTEDTAENHRSSRTMKNTF